jgi:cell division protein FtsB
MAADPTAVAARALLAMREIAADLAAERRENAALRRQVAELEAENERLRADATAASAHAAPRASRHAVAAERP